MALPTYRKVKFEDAKDHEKEKSKARKDHSSNDMKETGCRKRREQQSDPAH